MNRYETRTKNTLLKRRTRFIEKASLKHQNKFDYSRVKYVNAFVPVTIICPYHGEFQLTPKNYIEGSGCPTCGRSKLGWNARGSREERQQRFIDKSNQKHAFKYDYSKVQYVDGKTKVEIVCPQHGSFFQTPDSHMNTGLGCSKCNSSRGENLVRWWLNKQNIVFEEQKSFEGCRYKKPLKFDFFVPSFNLLIECNGKQHYEYAPIFHSNNRWNTLQIQQERDRIKQEWAASQKLNMLSIPYYNYDKIFDILSKEITIINRNFLVPTV